MRIPNFNANNLKKIITIEFSCILDGQSVLHPCSLDGGF